MKPPTYFRILVPLPVTVSFPSVRYVLQLESVPMAGRHQLMAHNSERGVWWMIGPSYHAREFLEAAVFQVGVPTLPATVADVVMRRLVHEGRAERVPVPADDLTQRRSAARQPLGAWLPALKPAALELGAGPAFNG